MRNHRRVAPRLRLSIRSTLLLVAIIALIMTFVTRMGRPPRAPYTAALRRMSEWCSSSVDAFDAAVHCDWSGPTPVWVVDKPAAPSVGCLLKLAYVQPPQHTGVNAGCNIAYQAVAVDGRSRRTCDIFNWAGQVGLSTVPVGEMVSLQDLVSKLPRSQSYIPDGNVLQVGFYWKGRWVTRKYDTGRLPPEVAVLIDKTWPKIPWMPRGGDAAPAKVAGGRNGGL